MALMVNCLSTAPAVIKAILSAAPLRMLGLWSYSIYIWQQPFYLNSRNGGLSTWLAVMLALLSGLFSFYAVEKPCRQYLNRIWRKQ
jgi:peptidoglycan/LPS O-acetylase OafA/YrhL